MPSFENGMFTYNDLDTKVADPEQSIADGLTVRSENMNEEIGIEEQNMYDGLRESGVEIEPFEQFYADGTAPQLTAK